MYGSFCATSFHNNRVDAAFPDIHRKIRGFYPVPTVNGCPVRRFDLPVQLALLGFKLDLKNISLAQLQCVQIGSVHLLNVQEILVRVFDAAARKALLIGTEQKHGKLSRYVTQVSLLRSGFRQGHKI